MGNNELKKWSEKHPPLIAIFASYAASSSEEILQYLTLIKNKTILYHFEQIPLLKDWLKFYRNNNHIRNKTIAFLKEFEGIPELLGESWDFITKNPDFMKQGKNEIEKLSKDEKIDLFNQSKVFVNDIQNLFFSELDTKFEKPFADEKMALIKSPEAKFVFTVIIPSYLFYGEHPLKIFRQAQKGDLESIDKILRLDPSALGDSFILEYFHKASKQENRTDFNDMINALQSPPKGKITLQKIKYKLAGLISCSAAFISYKLSTPEIESLFNALAVDLDRPELRLIETDDIYNDSIAKNIRREKRFWLRYFKMDKK